MRELLEGRLRYARKGCVFRRFLSEAASEFYPDLTIEQVICCPPVNGVDKALRSGKSGRFQDDIFISGLSKYAVEFSGMFRTYDVLPPFSVTTTLDKAVCLFAVC